MTRSNISSIYSHEKIQQTRDGLEKLGVKILNYTPYRHPVSLDDQEMFRPIHGYMEEYQSSYRYTDDIIWKLSMSDTQVNQLLDLKDRMEYTDRAMRQYRIERDDLSQKLTVLRTKTLSFTDAIKKVPGLREQWDEMRTIMILHGYDVPMDFI